MMATLTIPVEFVDENDKPLSPQVYIPLIPDKVDILGVLFQVTETRYLLNDGCYRVVVKEVADERAATAQNTEASESRIDRRRSRN